MVIDKDNIKILLFILVLGLGIGYAYINSNLNINGTAQINSANWDVHWANIQVRNGSVSGSNVVTQPTISNQTTVNYSVILSKPGDFYEFTIDAVNGGVIDAMIDSMEFKVNGVTANNTPDYLNYSITYTNGLPLEENHELLANTTETYKIRVEYNTDIELSQIPATNQTILLSFATVYRQATNAATPVDHSITRYSITVCDYDDLQNTAIKIGYAVPNAITQYETGAAAMTAFGNKPFCLKYKVLNNIVTESYIEFVITPAMASANSGTVAGTYSIRGGGATCTYNQTYDYYECAPDDIYYEDNKTTLYNAFGSSNCQETIYSDTGDKHTMCAIGSSLWGYAYNNGAVDVRNNENACDILAGERACCGSNW